MAGSKPGERRGGRQKGTPNKTTGLLKEAILAAFHRVGGEEYLAQVATDNPKAFCTLLGRVLPLQVTGDASNPVSIVIATGVPRAADD